MKALLITLSILVSSVSMADCTVTLKRKSDTAKGAKLDGVSFSAKQIDALRGICTVELKKMNKAELVADYTRALERKEAKEAKADNE